MKFMVKRTVLTAAIVAVVGSTAGILSSCTESKAEAPAKAAAELKETDGILPAVPVAKPDNATFYKADGSFDAEAVKKEYFKMMASFNYPVSSFLKTNNFWVCDFLQGDMAKLGMGGVFWINENGTYGETGSKLYKGDFKAEKFGYLGHDIYLLPGQMLPEHHHVGGDAGWGPKMEGWHVRHGEATFFGEVKGDDTDKPIAELPESERPWGYGEPWFKAKYYSKRKAGEMYKLVDPESWHFVRAGENGAIISEYATYHNHVEFSKPGMEFKCTGPKAE